MSQDHRQQAWLADVPARIAEHPVSLPFRFQPELTQMVANLLRP